VTTFVALLLYAMAGFCLFLVLLNRYLILLPDGPGKRRRTLAAFAGLVGGGAAMALLLPLWPFICAPAVILAAILLGEIWRAVLMHRYRGSKPIGSAIHDIRLATPVTTTHLACHRFEIALPHWHGDRLRIAHLSDLHVHAGLPQDYYEAAFATAQGQAPDLACITGDFVSHADGVELLRKVLRPIGSQGTFAVLGNHDYWAGPDPVREALREQSIRLLTNETARIAIGDRHIALTGCDDPWGQAPQQAGDRYDERDLRIALSHTPDNIYKLARRRADVVFSGHCHAGQIRIPLAGSIVVPSVYGRRFDHGHFVVRGTHLFVASGVGTADPPFRIYCQPDVFIVDILPLRG
jgi:uncharacterized protein